MPPSSWTSREGEKTYPDWSGLQCERKPAKVEGRSMTLMSVVVTIVATGVALGALQGEGNFRDESGTGWCKRTTLVRLVTTFRFHLTCSISITPSCWNGVQNLLSRRTHSDVCDATNQTNLVGLQSKHLD